jgi:hypothetical protein
MHKSYPGNGTSCIHILTLRLLSPVRKTLCYYKIIETRKEVARKKNPTEHVGKDQRGFRVETADVL